MEPVRSGHPGVPGPAALLQPVGQFYRQIDAFAHLPGQIRALIADSPHTVEGFEQPVEVFGQELLPERRILARARQILGRDQLPAPG